MKSEKERKQMYANQEKLMCAICKEDVGETHIGSVHHSPCCQDKKNWEVQK